MYYNDKTSSDPKIISDLFANYFITIHSNCASTDSSFDDLPTLFDLSTINIDLNDIETTLLCLDSNTSFDSDGISNYFIKHCFNSISTLFLLIFNKSLNNGYFLNCWKISKVVPVHRSGCKQNICN